MSEPTIHHLPEGAPRLDRFLAEAHPDIARSRWEAWIRSGQVLVDGVAATKPGTRLRAGAQVATTLPDPAPPAHFLEPEAFDLPTLFEDNRLWIVDKPAGLVVHPGPGHPSGTVLNALLGRLHAAPAPLAEGEDPAEEDEEADAPRWPGLVHRLDRFTTGCLAMAKDQGAQTALQAQFKARSVDKRYLAIARMSRRLPEAGSLLVDAPIGRQRSDRLKMAVVPQGRPSQTRVRVLGRAAGLALVECELLTGRTHQIRVHLAHLGAPILGDPLYGGAGAWMDADRRSHACPTPMLHAWRLALDHPGDGRRLSCEAPLPEAFREVLAGLGLAAPAPLS
ncbi:RluA family pseudouridine synthase [Mesoterricola sediminis]|uniref:Pseudouridine synthase n=1 Tax=Mesoterricola sediminis TaxID=2927980 RepID=A0AA48KD53_9BACT|nr:RluA family pseudouridine synthase [Mesoterricola sediminis]BDU77826.1 putative RNA pseudouridine synthase [Mesoterricola sediminis]